MIDGSSSGERNKQESHHGSWLRQSSYLLASPFTLKSTALHVINVTVTPVRSERCLMGSWFEPQNGCHSPKQRMKEKERGKDEDVLDIPDTLSLVTEVRGQWES